MKRAVKEHPLEIRTILRNKRINTKRVTRKRVYAVAKKIFKNGGTTIEAIFKIKEGRFKQDSHEEKKSEVNRNSLFSRELNSSMLKSSILNHSLFYFQTKTIKLALQLASYFLFFTVINYSFSE
jgi:hypothetical protein